MKAIKRKVVKRVAIISTLFTTGIILILSILNFLFEGWTKTYLIGKPAGLITAVVTVILGLVAFFALYWLLIFPPGKSKRSKQMNLIR